MQPAPNHGLRPLNASMRRFLILCTIIAFLVGFELFLLSDHTAQTFAWPVAPPITAAFLGAAYWAGLAVTLGAALQRTWVSARIALPGVFLFSILTLIATLLHLKALQFNSATWFVRVEAWGWLLISLIMPLLALLVLVWQLGAPGDVPPRIGPLPPWLRYLMGTQAVVLLLVGIALFLMPSVADPLWPWSLTSLAARMIGAWLIAIGLTAVLVVAQNDWPRVRVATNAYALLGALQIITVLRYHTYLNWSADSTWFFLIIALTMLGAGLLCLRLARRY